jgi:hypothetical protein
VRSFASSSFSIAHQPQELVISSDPSIPMTYESQLRKLGDGKPWRGPKEKSEQLMQLFIIGLSPKDGIVADLTASTGNQYFYFFYFLMAHHCFILIIFFQFLHIMFSSFAIM